MKWNLKFGCWAKYHARVLCDWFMSSLTEWCWYFFHWVTWLGSISSKLYTTATAVEIQEVSNPFILSCLTKNKSRLSEFVCRFVTVLQIYLSYLWGIGTRRALWWTCKPYRTKAHLLDIFQCLQNLKLLGKENLLR